MTNTMPRQVHDFRVCGLVAAVFTPFKENGELNLDVIDQYVDHLYENQVVNVFVNGTTGEGLSMNIEERKKHAEKWVKVGHGKLDKIIIHVGSHNLTESKELATHAKKIGASAIAALPPFFFKPQTEDDLVEYCRQIAACAPDLPFYYYHLPGMTGVTFDMKDFFAKAEHVIPSLSGVQFQSTHLEEASRVQCMYTGKFQVVVGLDELYLGALALGIDWAVGSTYNFLSNVVHRMVEAFNRSDLVTARLEQQRVQDVVRIKNKYGNGVAELKEIMRFIGPDVGPPRFPLKPLPDEMRTGLKKELTDIGFFHWTKGDLTPPQSPMSQRKKDKQQTLHRATSLLTDEGSEQPSSSKSPTGPRRSSMPGHLAFTHIVANGTTRRSSYGGRGRPERQTSNTSRLTEG